MGIVRKMGGKFLPNLNMTWRPIAEKYCEGKLKRIVKTKLKVPEIVSREQFGGCEYGWRAVYCALPDKGEEKMRKRAGNGGTKLCSDTTWFSNCIVSTRKERILNGALGFLLGLGLGDKKLCLDHGFHTRGFNHQGPPALISSHTLNIPS